MRLRDENETDEILFLHLGATHAVSAAFLFAILGKRHALDVTAIRKRDDARRIGDEVLERDLVLVRDDLGLALGVGLRGVLEPKLGEIVLDDRVDARGIGEDRLQLGDYLQELGEFRLELVAFETGKLIETHLENRIDLHVGKAEPLLQLHLRLVAVLRAADDRDDFIEIRDREEESVQNVFARLGLLELEPRAAGDHVETVIDIAAEEVLKVQDLRTPPVDREHDRTEGCLQLGVLV